jgi:hypothetical protein
MRDGYTENLDSIHLTPLLIIIIKTNRKLKIKFHAIAILERHSLENYEFDPFVFYSALEVEDRKELKLPSELNECDIKENLQDISQNKETIQN